MKIRKKVTLIINIIIIIALGVISINIFEQMSESGCRVSNERGIGAAISATIQAKHSDFLTNAVPYTMDDVLANNSFPRFKYQATATNTPAEGEICSNVAGTAILLNSKGTIFGWTWTPQVGNTPALLTENSTSAFP